MKYITLQLPGGDVLIATDKLVAEKVLERYEQDGGESMDPDERWVLDPKLVVALAQAVLELWRDES